MVNRSLVCFRTRQKAGRGAFTLIELLVVIAIIAILAAILFPVFSQAKAAAKKAVCLSDLKQITLAFLLYANDYDDHVVSRTYPNYIATGDQISWYGYAAPGPIVQWDLTKGLLSTYMRNSQIEDCPSAAGLSVPMISGNSYLDPNHSISLGINDVYLFYPTYPTSIVYQPVALTQIADPVETVAFGDAAYWNGPLKEVVKYEYFEPPSIGVYAHGRHSGICNIAWCDGHAKGMTPWVLTPDFGSLATPFINANLGQILHAGCPSYNLSFQQSACVDYYYMTLSKPEIGG